MKNPIFKSLFTKKDAALVTAKTVGGAGGVVSPSTSLQEKPAGPIINSPNSVQIYISCRGLVDLDVMGKSDPFVELFTKTEKESTWFSLGQSEVVWNDLNPDFTKVFRANYFFEKNQFLRAEIYEHDDDAPQLIGWYEIALNKLLTCPKQTVREQL